MKALVLQRFNEPFVLTETDDPRPGPDEIVLKVKAAGLCGTDLKIVGGQLPPSVVSLPHTPGHETAGVVEEVGALVKDIELGMAGIIYFYAACRDCVMCRNGMENLCVNIKRIGFELPGGFAEYVKLPAYNFCPIDTYGKNTVPWEQMAVLPDALATPYHAAKTLCGVRAGWFVLVAGIGGLGIHAVKLAELMGARVIAAARRKEPLELARQYGAEFTVDTAETNPVEAVMEITGGLGAHAVIETVGTERTLSWSLPSLRPGGTLALVGYSPNDEFVLPTLKMHYNEWRIAGSRVSTKEELNEVIDLVQRGKIVPMISKTYDWTRADDAVEALRAGKVAGRSVLTFPD